MGSNSLHVLKGIDFSVDDGELVAIMGSSGSGKSTLLNILGMLDEADSGEYTLDGVPIKNLNETKAAKSFEDAKAQQILAHELWKDTIDLAAAAEANETKAAKAFQKAKAEYERARDLWSPTNKIHEDTVALNSKTVSVETVVTDMLVPLEPSVQLLTELGSEKDLPSLLGTLKSFLPLVKELKESGLAPDDVKSFIGAINGLDLTKANETIKAVSSPAAGQLKRSADEMGMLTGAIGSLCGTVGLLTENVTNHFKAEAPTKKAKLSSHFIKRDLSSKQPKL